MAVSAVGRIRGGGIGHAVIIDGQTTCAPGETHIFDKTRLCKFFAKGRCRRGATCTFAHSESELLAQPDFYKTQLCIDFFGSGVCAEGGSCRYAHSPHEIRRTAVPRRSGVEGRVGPSEALRLQGPQPVPPQVLQQQQQQQEEANALDSAKAQLKQVQAVLDSLRGGARGGGRAGARAHAGSRTLVARGERQFRSEYGGSWGHDGSGSPVKSDEVRCVRSEGLGAQVLHSGEQKAGSVTPPVEKYDFKLAQGLEDFSRQITHEGQSADDQPASAFEVAWNDEWDTASPVGMTADTGETAVVCDLVVERTFLHLVPRATAEHRGSRSAPPVMRLAPALRLRHGAGRSLYATTEV